MKMGGGPARVVASIDGGARPSTIDLDPAPATDPGAGPDPNPVLNPAGGATEPGWPFPETRGACTPEGPNGDE